MQEDNFPNAIALSGGIASGKSSTCSLLLLHGFKIIDADKIAHEVLRTHAKEIDALFEEDILKDGHIERKTLGAIIFDDATKRKTLENFMHPRIKEEVLDRCKAQEKWGFPYIVDIPLFFETKNYNFTRSALVYTPQETQKKRLIEREGLSEEDAQKRINAQLPIDEKRELATFIIDNSQNLKHLQHEVDIFAKKVLENNKDIV